MSFKVIYNGSADSRTFKEYLSTNIPALLEAHEDYIYLDADLMSCIGTAKYAKAHPERCINVGIAEANMAGIAAGLSAAGFKPICHTFGPFASRRCYDQVFLSGGYAHNDLTMIGTDPGVTAAMNGGTHMPFEDVALYRAIPGATVIDVADTAQLENVFPKLVKREGVKFIRVNRKANTLMYEAGSDFEIGKGVVLREGKDITLISAGYTLGCTMKAAEELAKKGIEATVIDMFTVKPLDEALVIDCARKTGAVVTVENHNAVGGLYSAVADCLAMSCPTPMGRVAIEESFGEVGPVDYLAERFGLTAEHVISETEKTLARK